MSYWQFKVQFKVLPQRASVREYSAFMFNLFCFLESSAQHKRARVLRARDPAAQCGRGQAEVLPLLQHHMRRVAAQMLLTSLHLWPVASPPAIATCDATPYPATCGLPTKTLSCDGMPYPATCGLRTKRLSCNGMPSPATCELPNKVLLCDVPPFPATWRLRTKILLCNVAP